MIKKAFKGVIFDLDGTLADTLDDIAGSMNRILNSHGYPSRPVNDYKLLVGKGLDNLVKQALPEVARQPGIINTCLHELIIDYDENCLVKTHLYNGIPELLNELTNRNVKQAVFSNKAEPLTIKIVSHLLPDIPFVKISGARPDIPKKPDPAGALEISKIMKIKSDELVYMGDSDVDMLTAGNAGMFAVGVSWGFRSRKELLNNGAAIIIDAPRQILELF
ncbi:MAG TPA: HAD family hydrolase [Bacteroidales bacterium]|jgi:phosphoglycolate phosphatase|nr:HAD family hydrolase [Bacteroidales bacterium]